jgi:hypothetical protein
LAITIFTNPLINYVLCDLHVIWSANNGEDHALLECGHVQRFHGQKAAQAQITQFHNAPGTDENVRRLDVPMHYGTAVHVGNGTGNLDKILKGTINIKENLLFLGFGKSESGRE